MSIVITATNKAISLINALNEGIGRTIAWLTLAMVLVTFTIAVLRYVFNFGSVAMQESVNYMHALVFMLAAAYTLKHDGHVRVDILYQRGSIKTKAWIDVFGTLFLLLPVAGFIIWSSWDYVSVSWQISESSRNSGGLPGIFVLKTCIPVMGGLLALQGIALLLKNLLIALGLESNKDNKHG